MPLADIDATLARFGSAIDVMTANLLDLDDNPTNRLLDPDGLEGATATRIATARQTLSRLWEHFSQFKDLVDRARSLRGTGRPPAARMQELDRLLHGPSISLPPIEVPLARRGLLTPAETAVSTTPDQLLADMESAFDNAKREILAVDEAWRVLVPRLGTIDHEIARLKALVADLHEPGHPLLAGAQTTSAQLGQSITRDPLSVARGQVDTVEASLAAMARHLDELVLQRDTLGEDLSRSQALIEEADQLLAAGAAALSETRSRIAHPQGLLEPLGHDCITDSRRGLTPWLARLATLAKEGNWRSARKGLDEWTSVAEATRDAAREVAEANAAPLRERDELRGRFEAFRAKAAALGRLEEPGLAELSARARSCLYTAPTDLTTAAELVSRFGAALRSSQR